MANKAWRDRNPLKYKWQTLKDNATRRNIVFTITYEYFCMFVSENIDEFMLRGITANSFHIDRIEEHLGYVEGNLQMLKNIDNVKKYIKWVSRDEHKVNQFRFEYTELMSVESEECPF